MALYFLSVSKITVYCVNCSPSSIYLFTNAGFLFASITVYLILPESFAYFSIISLKDCVAKFVSSSGTSEYILTSVSRFLSVVIVSSENFKSPLEVKSIFKLTLSPKKPKSTLSTIIITTKNAVTAFKSAN